MIYSKQVVRDCGLERRLRISVIYVEIIESR